MTLDALLSEIEKRCEPSPTHDHIYIKYTREDIPKLIQAVRVLSSALEECCKKEPDGFGDVVAEEFESEGVKAGRKALQKATEILK